MTALLIASGCQTTGAAHSPKSAWAGGRHTVRTGETIDRIAQLRGVDPREIIQINGIEDPSDLKPGRVLYIPEPIDRIASYISKAPRRKKSENLSALPRKSAKSDKRQIALVWPVDGGVLFKNFDSRPGHLHEGISIGGPKGTLVFSAADGEVIYLGDDGSSYGRMVIIRHADPFITVYAHLDDILVTKGQELKAKDPIGTLGQTGGVDSPRVYFQLRKDRIPVDPEGYLKK